MSANKAKQVCRQLWNISWFKSFLLFPKEKFFHWLWKQRIVLIVGIPLRQTHRTILSRKSVWLYEDEAFLTLSQENNLFYFFVYFPRAFFFSICSWTQVLGGRSVWFRQAQWNRHWRQSRWAQSQLRPNKESDGVFLSIHWTGCSNKGIAVVKHRCASRLNCFCFFRTRLRCQKRVCEQLPKLFIGRLKFNCNPNSIFFD